MADDAFEVRPGDGGLLLTCEHASARLPAGWRWPERDARLHGTHWTFDLGAAELTHELSTSLRSAAVLSTFTRLLVDPNRADHDPSLFRTHADGLPVELNARLDDSEIRRRLERYWSRYHEAVDREAARTSAPVLLSVHTFTPVYEGAPRAMEVGVLFDREETLAESLAETLRAEGFVVAMNEPYSGKEGLMYAAERHAGAHGKHALELEVRQDLAVRPEVRARVVAALRRFVASS